jgi:hypothetical protein
MSESLLYTALPPFKVFNMQNKKFKKSYSKVMCLSL